MHFFYIRNYFSIISAEKIIVQAKITNAVAFLAYFSKEGYQILLEKQMNNKVWNVIKKYDGEKKSKIPFLDNFILKEKYKLKKIFIENKITNIYLSNINIPLERLFFILADEMNINIHFYEEGSNLYYQNNYINHKFKMSIKKILFFNQRKLYMDTKFYSARTVYAFLNNINPYRTYNKKVILDYNLHDLTIQNLCENLGLTDIGTLFLSRPMSEDGLINLDEEIEIFKYLNYKFNDVYVKFHPRESEDKKNVLRSKFKFKELPEQINDTPVEILVENLKLHNLIGYDTSTLFYTSELNRKVITYSVLNLLITKSTHIKLSYDFMKENFKNITFLNRDEIF